MIDYENNRPFHFVMQFQSSISLATLLPSVQFDYKFKMRGKLVLSSNKLFVTSADFN
jgi:hypothetical protein